MGEELNRFAKEKSFPTGSQRHELDSQLQFLFAMGRLLPWVSLFHL